MLNIATVGKTLEFGGISSQDMGMLHKPIQYFLCIVP